MKKDDLVSMLKRGKFKMKQLKVCRDGTDVTFKPAQYDSRAPDGPYVKELREALRNRVEVEDPAKLMTELQLAFKMEGYELIFTPPYMCVLVSR